MIGHPHPDLTGQVFGRLTVIERGPNSKSRERTWRCMCSCGNETIVPATRLIREITRSCGCLSIDQATKNVSHRLPKRHPNLEGQIFGRLTVVSASSDLHGHKRWNCHCECGNYTIVKATCLVTGQSTKRGNTCCIDAIIKAQGITDIMEAEVFMFVLNGKYPS
jgi:hypothetical protein